MKLFLISQTRNTGYDTFDSAVVAAPDEDAARRMDPALGDPFDLGLGPLERSGPMVSDALAAYWCDPDHVTVRYLGEAAEGVEQGVVCASFNAG